MENRFDITDPRDDPRGGYLSFTILDGATEIPGRISTPAMRILADDSNNSPTGVFAANKAKIRAAAYKFRRFNPGLPMIVLGARDFS
ncbi:hypothetical protein [Paraburkholderia sp.]|uniref:hypothetical protein n=1 Tax=Paraburkholderia sp. TaxID=1926495 RepID=UPI0023884A4A|nr:hypothetical protein [Paraburkholderia sp.]MDE1179227.1 hypothetical protein [Paraburkholderia sp.]